MNWLNVLWYVILWDGLKFCSKKKKIMTNAQTQLIIPYKGIEMIDLPGILNERDGEVQYQIF